MQVEITKTIFQFSQGEFEKVSDNEYNNLIIIKNIGFYERVISILKTIGREIGINCTIFNIKKTNEKYKQNITKNLKSDNLDFLDEHIIKVKTFHSKIFDLMGAAKNKIHPTLDNKKKF